MYEEGIFRKLNISKKIINKSNYIYVYVIYI